MGVEPAVRQLYYAARGHICKFVIHYKNEIKLQAVRYATFFEARHTKQPTVTGLSPCHRKVGGPFSNG